MKRNLTISIAAAALLALAAPARADEGSRGEDAFRLVHEALALGAELPATPPTLPSAASDRAAAAHEDVAFGRKGQATREAHRAAARAGEVEDAVAQDAAERAARGAAARAAGAANADAHAAAGQARAAEAREKHQKPKPPGPRGP
jgi:hypothetical protein